MQSSYVRVAAMSASGYYYYYFQFLAVLW